MIGDPIFPPTIDKKHTVQIAFYIDAWSILQLLPCEFPAPVTANLKLLGLGQLCFFKNDGPWTILNHLTGQSRFSRVSGLHHDQINSSPSRFTTTLQQTSFCVLQAYSSRFFRMGDAPGHDNHHNNDNNDNNNTQPHHLHNALRIQTENLAPRDSSPPPPSRIASQRSFTSLNGSYTSSPIITPSGSTHLLPSSSLTPLPSPLVAFNNANALPGSLSLDSLRLENSPRRKPYGGLGSVGIAYADGRRNVTEFPASQLSENYLERTISGRSLSGRVLGEEGLRREPQRSRTSSVSEDIFVLLLLFPAIAHSAKCRFEC